MRQESLIASLFVVSSLVPLALTDGVHDQGHRHDGDSTNMVAEGYHGFADNGTTPAVGDYPPTYFALADHSGLIYAHIGTMVITWVFVLPVAVVLSLARSRYTLFAQGLFTACNVFGIVTGVAYNSNTPDLYPNNAHHKVGWLVTCVVSAHVLLSCMRRLLGDGFHNFERGSRSSDEIPGFRSLPHALVDQRDRTRSPSPERQCRLSNDSGQGTERNTASLRSRSLSSASEQSSPRLSDVEKEYLDEHADGHDNQSLENTPLVPMSVAPLGAWRSSIFVKLSSSMTRNVWRCLRMVYNFVDRAILVMGFIALCLGVVTYGRFFEGRGIFNGLAHWIKGSVFFWLGIFSLGRWAGSFAELGWAWNISPRRRNRWCPSAEFVESALILFYGSTNIFMEHFSSWGGGWSAQDLEHVSITILFIGGGLLGMLIESTRVRELLNTTVSTTATSDIAEREGYDHEERGQEAVKPPEQYGFSVNPVPALVILLLGIMMSSHQQSTMISSMVHKQWGNLLTAAAFARGFTYILLYLKPPRSILPSRPPTELLASFGLSSGGIIFMASSRDTVDGMIHYNLDAMFMYTVTMGLVGLLMAWVVVVLAIKGWAIRRETSRMMPGEFA